MYTNKQSFINKHGGKLAVGMIAIIVGLLILWPSRAGAPTPELALEVTPVQTFGATLTVAATHDATAIPVTAQTGANRTPTPGPTVPPPTPAPIFYQVQAGDVAIEIAALFDISADALLDANNISDPTKLQIGQKLLVPVTATPTPRVSPTPTLSPTPTPEPTIYTVQSGDSLLAIAREFDTSVALILVANDMSETDILQVNQKLVIPSSDIQLDSPALIHVIQSGDTLSYLSFFYGSTVDDILAVNPGMEPTSLQIGDKIIIPVTSPPTNPDANPALPQITAPEAMPPKLIPLMTQMVQAVNTQRQTFGLPPYRPDEALARLALVHGQDMVARGYFAHTTPEGVTLDDRFDQQDIDATWTGENIQRNVKPKDQAAAEAVRWFMNSAPHRANILHRRFTKIGVGVAEGPPGWYTFVLVFADEVTPGE